MIALTVYLRWEVLRQEFMIMLCVFDRDVSEGVVQKLMQLKQALDQGDLNKASSVQVCTLPNLNGD